MWHEARSEPVVHKIAVSNGKSVWGLWTSKKARSGSWAACYLERKLEWKKEKKKKRHIWWIPHQAVLLTEMRESYLASEINKSVWIQKNSAGNGISAKFKISKCEWQLLTDVRFLFIYLFSGIFIGFISIFFCMFFLFSEVKRICIPSLQCGNNVTISGWDYTWQEKNLFMFIAAVDLTWLQSGMLLNNLGDSRITPLPSLD